MTKPKPLPPIDELRKRLAYRSDGVLIWKRPLSCKIKPGHLAGTITNFGYLHVQFNKTKFVAHRIVWAIVKREDPLGVQIDHINENKLDNRIANLRKASREQNACNQKAVKGYYFSKRQKKWKAAIKLNGKRKHLGYFDDEEQARNAYLRAKEKLHGEFMPTDMKHELGQIDGPTSQLDFFND
jgi:hypothetical protein